MRRAVILISVMTVLAVGFGLWADLSQQALGYRYLGETAQLRTLLNAGDLPQAAAQQAWLHALWQGEAKGLSCLVSHHHTRAVTTSMMALATALEQGWPQEALQALDTLEDALRDVAESDFPHWENIL